MPRQTSTQRAIHDLFDAPLPPTAASVWAFGVVAFGAAYCLSYAWLQQEHEAPLVAVGWSICAVLPWFAAFEGAKRRLIAGSPVSRVAPLFVLAAVASVTVERFVDHIVFAQQTAPLPLQALRRVPAIAAAVALTAIVVLRLPRAARASPRGALPVAPEAIDWVRAADNYLELHCAGRVITCRMTMRQAEAELERAGFVRIHRSLIVRGASVARVAGRGSAVVVIMNDGTELPVGPSYRAAAAPLGS